MLVKKTLHLRYILHMYHSSTNTRHRIFGPLVAIRIELYRIVAVFI